MIKDLKNAFERTLQGLAYWMAYKSEVNSINLKEAEIVGKAIEILSTQLPNYKLKSEVDYNSLNTSLSKQYADLCIFSRDGKKCQCVIEFKLGDNTNGGYKTDVHKLDKLKKLEPDIICLEIIAYRKSCALTVPKLFSNNCGKANRRVIRISQNIQIRVRRICNALSSNNARKMKKVVCLEII